MCPPTIYHALVAGSMVLCCGADAPAQEWAKQLFSATSHDFGTIQRGSKAEWKCELHNPLSVEVRVSSISSSCQCTTVKLDRRVLRPGDHSFVTVSIDTDSFTGAQAAAINVEFDRPFQASVALQVRAEVVKGNCYHPAVNGQLLRP